jgi:phosphoglycolate phosphatase
MRRYCISAAKLFPQEKENVRNALMDELCEFENGYLEEKGGVKSMIAIM